MSQYKVIRASGKETLEMYINDAAKNGYTALGSITVDNSGFYLLLMAKLK